MSSVIEPWTAPKLNKTSACGATQRSRGAEFWTEPGATCRFDTALLVHALRLDEAADGQVTEQRRTLEGATVDARISQLLRRNRLGRSVVEHDDRAGIVKERFHRAGRRTERNHLPGVLQAVPFAQQIDRIQVGGDDIGLLLKAFGLEIPAKIYTKGDIRELKSAVNPF